VSFVYTIAMMKATVVSVSGNLGHRFSKSIQESIRLIAGMGVAGDAHMGETVKHRSRVRIDPHQPNLRQVHLIHAELHDELNKKGFEVHPGDMGENITTRGIDLLGLSTGTQLKIGESAVIEITGLRNPCKQIDDFQQGLLNAVLDRDESGNLIRKAGVMAVVLTGGTIGKGDSISICFTPAQHVALERV
jgi:MOSC domain-containing protein YiiM